MDIASRLAKLRQSLLDLSTRNRLLSLPGEGKAGRIVHVRGGSTAEVFRLLVSEQRALQFVAAAAEGPRVRAKTISVPEQPSVTATTHVPITEVSDDLTVEPTLPSPAAADSPRDSKLQTHLTAEALQKRLLSMYYDARTLLEEQGVNVLYLALGQLCWYENEASPTARYAPLLLVPVSLDRRAAGARFVIQWDKEDLAENLSLAAKFKADFGLVLPGFEFDEDFDPKQYFDQIEAAISGLPRFTLQRDSIVLAFFSFAKFLMYRDLDPDVWPRERLIDAHPKITGLLRDGFARTDSALSDEAQLDELVPPRSRLHVVDADGSQTLVIAEVERGSDLVVQGPPGTGKSQTITNLIASAVHQGKTVLFVAEKLAALEVVKRNLARIGLDQIALELHSNKAHKRAVLDEVARTLSLVAAPSRVRDGAESLTELTSALNAHVQALHEPIGDSTMTAFAVIGALARLGSRQRDYAQLRLADVERWAPEARQSAHRALIDLAERVAAIGPPAAHPWAGVGLTAVLPDDGEAFARLAVDVLRAIEAMQASAAPLATLLQLPAPSSLRTIGELSRLGIELGTLPEFDRGTLSSSVWTGSLDALRQRIAQGRRLLQLRTELGGVTRADALDRDWDHDRQVFLAHGQSWLRWFNSGYREAMRQLELALTQPAPKSFTDRRALFDRLDEARKLELANHDLRALAESAFGTLWQGEDSDWDALEAQLRWVEGYRALRPQVGLELAIKVQESAQVGRLARQLQHTLEAVHTPLNALTSGLKLDARLALAADRLDEVPFTQLSERLQTWSVSAAKLVHWVSFHNASTRVRSGALLPFHAPIVQAELLAADCTQAFDQAFFQSLLRAAAQAHPELAQFEGRSHSQLVNRFRSIDREQLQWSRYAVGSRHLSHVPRANTGVGALGIVHREINRKRGNLPIRKLLASAGSVIQQAKPLFMMSPLSVAQFLQPGALEFDLLIIDEASQVEPVDALGAIARCKQMVVVGDDKQLPPTRFFSRMTGNDEDSEDEDSDSAALTVESILGLCASMGVPDKMLRWHYRSRHHSLIAVSNQEFYQRLYIVPSPENLAGKLGLKFHKVAGIYDRGKTRQNRIEAQEIARAVIRFAEFEPGLSLGVAAFSEAQKQAVLDAIEAERRQRPDLEAFFATSRVEPFFVKNLENVQGDERDVIMISIGYARDAAGTMVMAFGPLTNKGGERRLNVLISRARQRCEVFSSISADDIDLARTQSVGAKVLKLYLQFAETGRMQVGETAQRDPDSDFEMAVKAQLERAGHTVHAQVGTAGFFIDLAIVDPAQPGRHVLGIECDGTTYHAARSARDRDRLRQAVLEDHGWTMHRIWSADWLHRPADTLRETLMAVEAAIERSAARDELAEPPAAVPATGFEVVAAVEGSLPNAEPVNLSTPYVEARFAVPSLTPIHELPTARLASIVSKIVDIEQPVHEEEVSQRVRLLWGLARSGTRIAEAVSRAIAEAEQQGSIRREDGHFLIGSQGANQIRDRSNVESRTLRTPQMLPPSEIRLAIARLDEVSHGVSDEEIAPTVCRWLGFQKVGAELRAVVRRMK